MLKASRIPLLAAALLAGAGSAQAATYVSSVYASGLNNPRGLAFGPDGGLYIAEGGTPNFGGPTTEVQEGTATFGLSGSISRVLGGTQARIITGLPSLSTPNGAASGPQDIAFANGVGYVVIGLGADPAVRYTDLGAAPRAADLATLYSFEGTSVTRIADLGNFEAFVNPTGDQIDSNPYHIAAGPNGVLVTDAGGNSVVNVTPEGAMSAVATFFSDGPETVPTGVTVGPDGAIYVGELTGFPFTPGSASIFRVDATTGERTLFASGFTTITDIAFGADGTLYALQFADAGLLAGGPGSIQRLNADGSLTTIFGGLIAPTGLEIGADGAFYVTNLSPAPFVGEVLRIALVPEPGSWAMMIVGFGAVGGAMRRRRTRIAFA